jgi:hypothetical protein
MFQGAQIKQLNVSAMHSVAEPWRLIIPTTIKNCFVEYVFLNYHISSSDDSAVKLREDEKNAWHSLQPFQVQSEDCTKCGSALEVIGVWHDKQVLDQHLTRP